MIVDYYPVSINFFFIIVILMTRPSLQIISSVGKMMPRRWISGRKSRLPQKSIKWVDSSYTLEVFFPEPG